MTRVRADDPVLDHHDRLRASSAASIVDAEDGPTASSEASSRSPSTIGPSPAGDPTRDRRRAVASVDDEGSTDVVWTITARRDGR